MLGFAYALEGQCTYRIAQPKRRLATKIPQLLLEAALVYLIFAYPKRA